MLANSDSYSQCWLVQKSLPEVLFQCWLVEKSLLFPAKFTDLSKAWLQSWLKGVNMCLVMKSYKELIVASNKRISVYLPSWFHLTESETGLRRFADRVLFIMPVFYLMCDLLGLMFCIVYPQSVDHFTNNNNYKFSCFNAPNQYSAVELRCKQ